MPLLHQKVELDGMRLEGARVNTAGLIEGMTLRGKLDDMFVAAHGADLAKETLIVDNLQMEMPIWLCALLIPWPPIPPKLILCGGR